MDVTTEAGALFNNYPRHKGKTLLLDLTIVNPCVSSNLEGTARQTGKHLAEVVERKKNKYRGSFPATYSRLPLATCGELGPDMHALIKELAHRRVNYSPELHSEVSRRLAEGTEVARLRRRFSFVLQQALSFLTGADSADKGSALLHRTVIIGPGFRNESGRQRSATLTYNSRSRVPEQGTCKNRGINTNGQDRRENGEGMARGTVKDNERCNDSVGEADEIEIGSRK